MVEVEVVDKVVVEVVVGVGVEVEVEVIKNQLLEKAMTKTLEISDETYERIKTQLLEDEKIDISSYDDIIGHNFFFRTVTYHLVGKVVKRIGNFFQLEQASWVADSGRFMDAIKKGTLDEVEPVGTAFVNLESVTDMFPWRHKLPTEQK